MNFFLFLLSFGVIILAGCNQYRVTKLKEDQNKKITYSASEKYGYKIDIDKKIGIGQQSYSMQLTKGGRVMYIFKSPVLFDGEDYAARYHSLTEYLVTDTTDTLLGAKFFGEDIIGFYGSNNVNFITSNNYKGKSSPFLPEEKSMFMEIDSLMKRKKLNFIPFDSSHTLFWFKYDLQ